MVGEGDTLGSAGGTRGVHDVRQVPRLQRGPALGVTEVSDAGGDVPVDVIELDVVEEKHRGVAGGKHTDGVVVGEDQLGGRLGEDVLQPVAGVLGVDRQIGRAGLEDRQEPDDELCRAGQRQCHDRFGARAPAGQLPCQTVRPRVHLRVRQLRALEDDRHRVRALCGLGLEERGDGEPGRRCGRVVELLQQAYALGGLQDVDAAHRLRGVGDQPAQDPYEPCGDDIDRLPVQDVLLVLKAEPQVRVGVGHDGERVVGAGGRADAGEGDAGRGVGVAEAVAVDGVGLEHHQGVEQGREPGGPVDLGQAVVVVVQERRLPLLQAPQHVGE